MPGPCRVVGLVAGALVVAGCANGPSGTATTTGPSTYSVAGQSYHVLASAAGFSQVGKASWYGRKFHGRSTASGESYDMYRMTAAHKRLPLGSRVRVTDLDTQRQVIVRINDRGPFHDGRIIDLSYAAARRLGIIRHGSARVRVRALTPDSRKIGGTGAALKTQAGVSASGFSLQAGAFARRANAEQQKARIKAASGGPVRVTHASQRALYRVRVGPFKSRTQRASARRRLAARGVATINLGEL